MWNAHREEILGGRGLRFAIDRDALRLSYAQALRCWKDDSEFRTFFMSLLAEAPFSAFRWETPPVTAESVDRAFEFVLLDSPGLARQPDPQAFAEHFARETPKPGVVAFPNLGKDAIMVVPCPIALPSAYGHLAAFVRKAPESQRHALWELVGETMERRLGATPVWLSTAGAGVSWLHVRLDDRPKYYGYAPYRDTMVT